MIQAIQSEKDWKGSNTSVTAGKNLIIVQLYRTIIFEFNKATNTFTFNSGGYETSTTKSRLNAIFTGLKIPGGIYQKNYSWYLSTEAGDKLWEDNVQYNANQKTWSL
jgi:hypothetical protein